MDRKAMKVRPSRPRMRRFSLREYYQLADLGFFEGERVELIGGRMVALPAIQTNGVDLSNCCYP